LSVEDVDTVRRVLYLNGLRGADIDDGVQEVEVRALEQRPDGVRSTRAWACVVASNLAIDQLRRADTARRLVPVLAEPSPGVADPDLRDAVRKGLMGLDATHRATVVLRYYADLSIGEIAGAMRVPEGTVKSRLHHAVSRLRVLLPEESLR
jgi:RNA polymerase sigma-70 factor (ECF subfamily)